MQLVALQVNEQGHPLKSLSPWQIFCCAFCLGAPGFASQAVKAGVEVEGASAPMVFPTFPLSPFLPSGCVYAVVSLPLSSVSFRCWLISQESRVPLPQPVPSSSFYLAALFSGYVRSAALDAFSKHNELGPAQLSTAGETQHLLPTCSDCPVGGWLVLASRSASLVLSAHFSRDKGCRAVPKSSLVFRVMVQMPIWSVQWESSCLLCFRSVFSSPVEVETSSR